MKAKLALVTLFCVAVSGCATVDLVNVGNSSASSIAASESSNKVNVVKRAASKLYSAFTSEGWAANKSRERVQSAASVLLRGLDTDSSESPLSHYADKTLSVSQIHTDIQTAQGYVAQTTKAAEVYLDVASDDTNLREELASLQKALIVSREAELEFKTALTSRLGAEDKVLISYSQSVDTLRDITDDFGDRVRSGRTMTSALQPEIN